jgi:pre-mRNA-splicing factor 18
MDALKAEIASKRKARDNGPPHPNKYMRRGDIERMREEEEQKAREEATKKVEVEAAEQATQPKVRFFSPFHYTGILRRRWSLE